MKKITDETIEYTNNASISDTTIFYSRVLFQIYYDIFARQQMLKQAENNQQEIVFEINDEENL